MSYIKSYEEFLMKMQEEERCRNEQLIKPISTFVTPTLMKDRKAPGKPRCKREPTEDADEERLFICNNNSSSYVNSDSWPSMEGVQIKTDLIDAEESRLYDPLKRNQDIGVYTMNDIEVKDHFLSPYYSGDGSFNQYPMHPCRPATEPDLTTNRGGKHRKVYNCTECTFQTGVKKYLTDHNKFEHGKITVRRTPPSAVLKCTECSYQTHLKKDLRDHRKVVHCKIYGCMFCPFQTMNEDNLKSHTEIAHTEELPQLFRCGECLFECDQKDYLLNHYQHAHGFTGSVSLFQVVNESSLPEATEIEVQEDSYVITM